MIFNDEIPANFAGRYQRINPRAILKTVQVALKVISQNSVICKYDERSSFSVVCTQVAFYCVASPHKRYDRTVRFELHRYESGTGKKVLTSNR